MSFEKIIAQVKQKTYTDFFVLYLWLNLLSAILALTLDYLARKDKSRKLQEVQS